MGVIVLVKDGKKWTRLCSASARGSLHKVREAFKNRRLVAVVEAEDLKSAIDRVSTQRRPDRLLYRDPDRTDLVAILCGGGATEAFCAYADSIQSAHSNGALEPGIATAMVSEIRVTHAEQ